MQFRFPRRTLVRSLLHLLPAALCAGGMLLSTPARADQPEFMPGEVLVGLAKPDPNRNIQQPLPTPAEIAQGVGRVLSVHPELGVARIELNRGLSVAQAVAALRVRAGVRYAEPNHIHRVTAVPNDTHYATRQWGPKKIRMDLAWDLWVPVAQKVIAIIDTGAQLDHPDLVNVLYRDANGNVIGYNVQSPANPPTEDVGHGTHVAGSAAAEINNAKGVAGVAGWNPAIGGSTAYIKIMPVKALTNGTGTDLDVAVGINWSVANGASVLNLSLGSTGFSQTLANSVSNAIANDVVVVAAAGNNGNNTKFYPAANDGVISVAATDSTDTLTSWSTFGTWVKVAAPGRSIYSTYKNSGYTYMDGTSMASPHVAGEAVLLRSAFPSLTNVEISNLILNNTDPYNPYAARTIGSGAGRINVYKALVAAGAGGGGLTGHSLSPNPVTGASASTGTVTINAAAPAGGKLVTLSSDTGSVTVPPSVTIPAGSTSTTYTATTQAVAASTTATITATTTENSMTSSLIVNPPVVSAVSMSPSSVSGGNNSTGTVTLTGPAPTSGLTVTLTSNKPQATVPASVTVNEGETTATFTATTTPVTATTAVTIKAITGAVIKTATLNVKPPYPLSVTFSPTTVVSGYTTTGKVTLNGPAPTGGTTVALTSNKPQATVPASIVIPAGETEGAFTVNTGNVSATITVTISARANSSTKTGAFSLNPLFKSMVNSPNNLYGGQSSTGTVNLNAPAISDVVVTLSSNNAVVGVPADVTVPAGSSSATFPITTSPVAAKTVVSIGGTALGTTRSANLTIKAPALSSVTFSPTLVATGQTATGKLTLNAPAPAGFTVTLTSGNGTAAPVPMSVTFGAGEITATFSVTGGPVDSQTTVSISGTDPNGFTRSGSLTVKP